MNKAPQFAYTGDQDEVEAFGVTFARNEHVDVVDSKAAGKLRGNPDFVEIIDGAEVVPAHTATAQVAAKPRLVAKPSKAKQKAMEENAVAKKGDA